MSKTLFTDDNPKTTLHGLSFKNVINTKKSIKNIDQYFNKIKNEQKINDYSPKNLLPKMFLQTIKEINSYYKKQKLYRILGLLNRAKVIYKRYPNNELYMSIKLLSKQLIKYKSG
jgi:hypothetical protein